MAAQWAQLRRERRADTASAWSNLHESSHNPVDSSSGWAQGASSSSAPAPSTAAGWSGLGHCSSDSDDDQPIGVQTVVAELPTNDVIQLQIASINANTSLQRLEYLTKSLVSRLGQSSSTLDYNWRAQQFDCILSNLAEHGSNKRFLDNSLDLVAMDKFVQEQFASTDATNAKAVESHTAESQRLGIPRQKLGRRRAIGSIATIVLQRACADEFMALMCRKVIAQSGTPETYFEKHRGDETPFAKVSAKDAIWVSDAKMLEDNVDPVGAIAVAAPAENQIACKGLEQVSTRVDSVSANLKVYQTEVEVGGLFILAESELFLTFKLIAPLARVDRCTGRNYANLHEKQSNLLESSKRFKRCQRLHTSDGDKAQSLAERVLEVRLKTDSLYGVPTLRNQ